MLRVGVCGAWAYSEFFSSELVVDVEDDQGCGGYGCHRLRFQGNFSQGFEAFEQGVGPLGGGCPYVVCQAAVVSWWAGWGL